MKLITKRLILRKPGKKDIRDLIEGLNNLNVSKYLSKVPYPYKKKDSEWWINDCKKQFAKKQKRNYPFHVELKSEKKLIGAVGLHEIDHFNKSVEIGYWVNEKYQRQGVVKEALIKLIDFAFNKIKLNRLVIKAYPKNKASNNVAKKLNFKFEGTERKSHRSLSTNKIYDAKVHSLLKKDWPKIKRRLK